MKNNFSKLKKFIIFLSAILFTSYISAQNPIIIYVDAINGSATGSGFGNWGNSMKHLQDAIQIAKDFPGNYEIWVAQGTYFPDLSSNNPSWLNDRSKSFNMLDNMEILGGFDQLLAPTKLLRNPDLYETVLSGDINTSGVNTDNSYHVIYNVNVSSSALLDGFTVTLAYGDIWGQNRGGGMYNYSSSPIIKNCTFIHNETTDRGGGVIHKFLFCIESCGLYFFK